MHPFKKEKSLNSSQFTPVAGFLGIIIIILPFLRDNGRPKIEKGVIKSVRGGHNMKSLFFGNFPPSFLT